MAYVDQVATHLALEYGDEHVEREVHLDETDRFVDFVVDCGDVSLAIEVENGSGDVVDRGYGQALLYAKHQPHWVPVIYYNPDGDNEAELSYIGESVALVPFDPNT